jgi:hypothetical protein
MTRKSSFITRARSLGVDTELCWGDEETPWEDEVSDNESVTVDKDGVRPLPDTLIVVDWENGASSLDAYYSDVARGADGSPGNRVIADAAKAGSYGLEMEAGGNGLGWVTLTEDRITPTPGDRFSYWHRFNTDCALRQHFYFDHAGPVDAWPDGPDFRINETQSFQLVADESVSTADNTADPNTWYLIIFDWFTDDTIRVQVQDDTGDLLYELTTLYSGSNGGTVSWALNNNDWHQQYWSDHFVVEPDYHTS